MKPENRRYWGVFSNMYEDGPLEGVVASEAEAWEQLADIANRMKLLSEFPFMPEAVGESSVGLVPTLYVAELKTRYRR